MRLQLEQHPAQQPQRPEIDFLEGISIINLDANQETAGYSNTAIAPETLSTLLLDKTGYFYYKISNLKLSYFLNPSFMEKVNLKRKGINGMCLLIHYCTTNGLYIHLQISMMLFVC